MMPASNGTRHEVVFFKRDSTLMLLYFLTMLSGCTSALPRNNKTFSVSSFICFLSFCSTFFIMSIRIQDVASAKKERCPSFDATFALKQNVFLFFEIITALPTIQPSALTKNATVIFCFDFFHLYIFFLTQDLW